MKSPRTVNCSPWHLMLLGCIPCSVVSLSMIDCTLSLLLVYGETSCFPASRLSLTISGNIAILNNMPLSAQPCGVPEPIGNVVEMLSLISILHVAP